MKLELLYLETNDEKYKKEIFEVEKKILLLNLPNVWNSNIEGNKEVEIEVEFEKYVLALGEHTNEKIDSMSVFTFNSLILLVKEKYSKDGRSDN